MKERFEVPLRVQECTRCPIDEPEIPSLLQSLIIPVPYHIQQPAYTAFERLDAQRGPIQLVRKELYQRQNLNSFLGLDLKNAFNSLKRNYMLPEIKQLVPELWAMVRWSYERHSKLYLSDGSTRRPPF